MTKGIQKIGFSGADDLVEVVETLGTPPFGINSYMVMETAVNDAGITLPWTVVHKAEV